MDPRRRSLALLRGADWGEDTPLIARFRAWRHYPLLLEAHAPGYPRTPLVDLAAGRDAALAAGEVWVGRLCRSA